MIIVTSDARRRRAVWQILLLSAGFLVLVAISVSSVLLVNKARDDSAWWCIPSRWKARFPVCCWKSAAPKALRLSADIGAALSRRVSDRRRQHPACRRQTAKLTDDNPVQVENYARLRKAIEQRLSEFARGIDRVKNNDVATSVTVCAMALRPMRESIAETARNMRPRKIACSPCAPQCRTAHRSARLLRDDRRLRVVMALAALGRAGAGMRNPRARDEAEAKPARQQRSTSRPSVDESHGRPAAGQPGDPALRLHRQPRPALARWSTCMGFTGELEARARRSTPAREDRSDRRRPSGAARPRRRRGGRRSICRDRSASSAPRPRRWTG